MIIFLDVCSFFYEHRNVEINLSLPPKPILIKGVEMTDSKTSDALEIIYKEFYEGKPERIAQLAEARINDDVARKIRELREEVGLSQRKLAELVGTTASVICRLEDADYEGHSLSMLNRIASALDRRIKIDFVPLVNPDSSIKSISQGM